MGVEGQGGNEVTQIPVSLGTKPPEGKLQRKLFRLEQVRLQVSGTDHTVTERNSSVKRPHSGTRREGVVH